MSDLLLAPGLPIGRIGRPLPFNTKSNWKGQTDRCVENKLSANAPLFSFHPDGANRLHPPPAWRTLPSPPRMREASRPVQAPTKSELVANLKTAKTSASKCRRRSPPAPTVIE